MRITKGAIIKEPGSSTENKTGNWRTFKPIIDKAKCCGDGRCWAYCPDNAIKMVEGKAVINYDFCKGCLICVNICPFKAISVVKEEK